MQDKKVAQALLPVLAVFLLIQFFRTEKDSPPAAAVVEQPPVTEQVVSNGVIGCEELQTLQELITILNNNPTEFQLAGELSINSGECTRFEAWESVRLIESEGSFKRVGRLGDAAGYWVSSASTRP